MKSWNGDAMPKHLNWMNVGLETFAIRRWGTLMKRLALKESENISPKDEKLKRNGPRWLRDKPVRGTSKSD